MLNNIQQERERREEEQVRNEWGLPLSALVSASYVERINRRRRGHLPPVKKRTSKTIHDKYFPKEKIRFESSGWIGQNQAQRLVFRPESDGEVEDSDTEHSEPNGDEDDFNTASEHSLPTSEDEDILPPTPPDVRTPPETPAKRPRSTELDRLGPPPTVAPNTLRSGRNLAGARGGHGASPTWMPRPVRTATSAPSSSSSWLPGSWHQNFRSVTGGCALVPPPPGATPLWKMRSLTDQFHRAVSPPLPRGPTEADRGTGTTQTGIRRTASSAADMTELTEAERREEERRRRKRRDPR